MHARYIFWYISLLSSGKQQCETTKFKILWRMWAQNGVNFPLILERRSYQFSSQIVRPHSTTWTNWNNHKVTVVEVTRSYIFKWHFRCLCHCRCLSSLLKHPEVCWRQVSLPSKLKLRLFLGKPLIDLLHCKVHWNVLWFISIYTSERRPPTRNVSSWRFNLT